MQNNLHLFVVWWSVLLFHEGVWTSIVPSTRAEREFTLVLLHNNDMHGRFEETENNSGTCQDAHKNVSCVGGFARTANIIRTYRQAAQEGTSPPVLYLNAGDTYVGTAWSSLFTWNISSEFVNLLKPDALTLGNHEFDFTVENLALFIGALTSPIVAANLNFTNEPAIGKVQKSVVLEVSGRKIGVIGYLTPETIQISSPGNVAFEEEIIAIRRESELLNSQGVTIIIALGHSGYLKDKEIAREVDLVDVVVGGHSHSFLWTGVQPSTDSIEGPYPTVVTQPTGKRVPVVQAYAFTKYMGVLNLTFDGDGNLTEFSGKPILLDNAVPQDPDVLSLLEVYRPEVNALNEQVVGTSRVILEGSCRHSECNFGNLIADALVTYVASVNTERWTNAPIALYNGGAVRNTIDPTATGGNITRGELLGAMPFDNQVVELTLTGSDLVKSLEQGARGNGDTSYGEFMQVSGLKVQYDMSKPSFSRVLSVKARCGVCAVPAYEEVVATSNYTIVTSSFLSDGGDGITVFKNFGMDKKIHTLNDLDTVAWYFGKYSPVYPEVSGRIRIISRDQTENESENGDDEDESGEDEDEHGSGSENAACTIRNNIVIVASVIVLVATIETDVNIN
ncbi:protein 5NUC-like [Cylas formicarius]|uniref:protein 5NUC-like n=1 Tax=Cylas formicarius TaxID=197179 RepID=UPI00295841E3|nr:protein 5NUC-like [Cylas formicarius]